MSWERVLAAYNFVNLSDRHLTSCYNVFCGRNPVVVCKRLQGLVRYVGAALVVKQVPEIFLRYELFVGFIKNLLFC
jgi:hypothetical protein